MTHEDSSRQLLVGDAPQLFWWLRVTLWVRQFDFACMLSAAAEPVLSVPGRRFNT